MRIWLFLIVLCFSGFTLAGLGDVAVIAKLAEQIQLMEKQKKQLEKSYEAITKKHHLGLVDHDATYKDYVPKDFNKTYQKIGREGYSGLTSSAKALYSKNKVSDVCEHIPEQDEKKLCEARVAKSYQDQAFALDAHKKSSGRIERIESLMKKINETEDQKAIGELQARIAAEQAILANEQSKLEMFRAASKAEDEILAQRANEMGRRTFHKTGSLNIKASDIEFY